ncbi:MAG: hypothetical protein M1831_004365 [Alyxoria varia]|nr:MAG: hypothetical protein M1831_004365 [Alyxoria varia]
MLSGSTAPPSSTLSTDINTVSSFAYRSPSSYQNGLDQLRSYTRRKAPEIPPRRPFQDVLRRSDSQIGRSTSPRLHNSSLVSREPELNTAQEHSQPPNSTAHHRYLPPVAAAGWMPSVNGSNGAAIPTTQLQSVDSFSALHTSTDPKSSSSIPHKSSTSNMTRNRSTTTPNGTGQSLYTPNEPTPTAAAVLTPSSDTLGGQGISGLGRAARSNSAANTTSMPSIQFIPAPELSRNRPSLDFPRISRTLPRSSSIIRVGRYSERDTSQDHSPNTPSDAPVGFKSKVVSRKHCEFFFEGGQWYIKDVKSSSGTFLNHIRLSQPGSESKPFPIKDGDVVQLGIDFKGGEEMIFRCVKIRVELNRGWQRGLNKFNKSTLKQLQKLANNGQKEGDTASKHSTECTICLNSIAPCQALFVAPCSHTWHYKCIKSLLEDKTKYPQFLCPNCRAQTDLEADIENAELQDFEQSEAGGEEDDDGVSIGSKELNELHLHSTETPHTHAGVSERRLANATPILEERTTNIEDDPELSWVMNSMSLREAANRGRIGSLDDTIIATRGSRAGALNTARGLNPSASAFIPVSSSPPLQNSPSNVSPPRLGPSASTTLRRTARPRVQTRHTDSTTNFASHARNNTLGPDNASHDPEADDTIPIGDLEEELESLSRRASNIPAHSSGLNTSNRRNATFNSSQNRSGSTDALGREGPMTPRNNAGPFVFDGSAPDLPSLGHLYLGARTGNGAGGANVVDLPWVNDLPQEVWRERERERRVERMQ